MKAKEIKVTDYHCGYKFIEKKIAECSKRSSQRKARNFIHSVDRMLIVLDDVKPEHYHFTALAFKRQLAYTLYEDMILDMGMDIKEPVLAKKKELDLKNELYGYLKFKVNKLIQAQTGFSK